MCACPFSLNAARSSHHISATDIASASCISDTLSEEDDEHHQLTLNNLNKAISFIINPSNSDLKNALQLLLQDEHQYQEIL
ncbi:hypothetical protein O3M35_004461 [Rhynocoris fuscipes]|uniref:Uncharacterized protein n=1 Tax=Rhynocoris fuscipes TaxID=488301 RepID=A0AAW1CI64_9HEMI